MRKFWKRDHDGIERLLRASRPEPPPALVDTLVDRATPRRVRQWSRVAFAGAMTVFVVGFFASFGGLGYAATSAHQAVSSVTRVVSPDTKGSLGARSTHSAGADQYGEQSAGDDQYGHQEFTPPTTKPAKVIKVAGISTQTPSQSSELPFTGLGLAFTAAVGLMLLALGALLRRRESRAE